MLNFNLHFIAGQRSRGAANATRSGGGLGTFDMGKIVLIVIIIINYFLFIIYTFNPAVFLMKPSFLFFYNSNK